MVGIPTETFWWEFMNKMHNRVLKCIRWLFIYFWINAVVLNAGDKNVTCVLWQCANTVECTRLACFYDFVLIRLNKIHFQTFQEPLHGCLLGQWSLGVSVLWKSGSYQSAFKSLYRCTELSFASNSTAYSTDGKFITIVLQNALISIKMSCKGSEAILGP